MWEWGIGIRKIILCRMGYLSLFLSRQYNIVSIDENALGTPNKLLSQHSNYNVGTFLS